MSEVPGPAILPRAEAAIRPDNPGVPDIQGRPVDRRSVLKGLAIGIGTSVAGALHTEWRDSGLSLGLLAPETDDIPTEVPPELAGRTIPYTNERHRPHFGAAVADALVEYESTGGQPYYQRPAYYIGKMELLRALKRGYDKYGRPEIDASGKPYAALINFSGGDFKRGASLVYTTSDPGTSAKSLIAQRLAEATRQNGLLGEEQEADIIKGGYRELYADAMAYLMDKHQGRQAPTSTLCAYFLGKNKGDLVTSLLDTTLFLKMVARSSLQGGVTHPAAVGVSHRPKYVNALLSSELFYDEFSAKLPLEKLLTIVDDTSQLNDTQESKWKDFDPVNRAGTAYHVWNLLTLIACADPTVAQKLVVGYYSGMGSYASSHGSIKVEADLRAVHQAHDIRSIFDRYSAY